MTLNYIHAANLPSVRKNLLFNPSQHPPPHPPPPPSLMLQNDPVLRYPGHIQRDDEYLT